MADNHIAQNMYYARQPNVSRLNKLKKELILEVLI